MVLQAKPEERDAEAKPTAPQMPPAYPFPLSTFHVSPQIPVLKGVGLWCDRMTSLSLTAAEKEKSEFLSPVTGAWGAEGARITNSQKEEGVGRVWDRGSAGGSEGDTLELFRAL